MSDSATVAAGDGLVSEEPTLALGTMRPRRPWWRRWLRRLVITVVVAAVLATGASFSYNAATAARAAPPAGLSYVRAGDLLTRYRVWGAAGSPIVLVHGAAESADTWSRLAPLLAKTHRVYAYDVTGWGYSQRRGPYDAAHLAAQLLGFVTAMRLDRPVLVGHSLGAAIVAEATLRAPTSVGGALFLDGDALTFTPPPPARYLLTDPFRTSILRLGVRSDALIRSLYNGQCAPDCPRLDAAGVDQWRRPFQQSGAEAALWQMMRAGMVGLPIDRLEKLRAVPIPKAVVFGGDDMSTFTKQSPFQTAQRIGAPAPVIIPGARHLTMISSPATVAAAIESLVTRAA